MVALQLSSRRGYVPVHNGCKSDLEPGTLTPVQQVTVNKTCCPFREHSHPLLRLFWPRTAARSSKEHFGGSNMCFEREDDHYLARQMKDHPAPSAGFSVLLLWLSDYGTKMYLIFDPPWLDTPSSQKFKFPERTWRHQTFTICFVSATIWHLDSVFFTN